jgi:hypothetical protein
MAPARPRYNNDTWSNDCAHRPAGANSARPAPEAGAAAIRNLLEQSRAILLDGCGQSGLAHAGSGNGRPAQSDDRSKRQA